MLITPSPSQRLPPPAAELQLLPSLPGKRGFGEAIEHARAGLAIAVGVAERQLRERLPVPDRVVVGPEPDGLRKIRGRFVPLSQPGAGAGAAAAKRPSRGLCLDQAAPV